MLQARRMGPIALLLILLVTINFMGGLGRAQASSGQERIADGAKVLKEMQMQSDVQMLLELLQRAEGVAIFPSVVKAGLMLGGQYGEGLVMRYDAGTKTWYGPSFVTLKGVSYGMQFGLQSTALVLVITNEQGMDSFLRGDKVTLGGDLSVAAGPLGRRASLGTDLDLKASIYSYSLSKGIFAGISLDGSAITVDEELNDEFWGEALTAKEILSTKTTPTAQPLIAELETMLNQ